MRDHPGPVAAFRVASSPRVSDRERVARMLYRAGRRRAVSLFCAHVSDRWHAPSRQSSYHNDRAHGPYRWSRNPVYLSFSLFQLGVAFWVNSLWLLVTLIPAVALMSFVVIPREERYLETRFPADYLPYRASVRRWL